MLVRGYLPSEVWESMASAASAAWSSVLPPETQMPRLVELPSGNVTVWCCTDGSFSSMVDLKLESDVP